MKRIEAVIFDWAGTTVDHGSLAPVRAVTELFARHGVALTDADARRDMGIFKKDHIRRILAMPHIGDIWRERCGSAWDERQVEMLFQEFQPLQMEILEAYSQVIPGVRRSRNGCAGEGSNWAAPRDTRDPCWTRSCGARWRRGTGRMRRFARTIPAGAGHIRGCACASRWISALARPRRR